jgi:hypothetical protein
MLDLLLAIVLLSWLINTGELNWIIIIIIIIIVIINISSSACYLLQSYVL